VTEPRLRAWGDELRAVHKRLRDALEAARQSVVEGADAGVVSRDLQLFCLGFCTALSGHHTSEDRALFPILLERRPDLAPVIDRLKQDHNMIEYLIGDLERSLERGEDARARLQRLDGIGAIMENHFRYEESRILDVLDTVDDAEPDGTTLFGPLA
jgi:hypothetical protein